MNPFLPRKSRPNRRQFLVQSGCASMGITGMVNTLAHLRLMQGALNAQGAGSGYKALVCVFLAGGNDSNNLLVPDSGTARADYNSGRGALAIPAAQLQSITPSNLTASDPLGGGYLGNFGVHPKGTHIASLFNAGELAFVANVGTLNQPGVTRANFSSFPKPPQLFSHADQQVQWQSSVPDKPFTSGWGGRVADLLNSRYNPASGNASMSISIAGVNSFQTSATGAVSPYYIGTNGVVSLAGYGTNYANALNDPGVLFDRNNYKNNQAGKRLKAFEQIATLSHANLLEEGYNSSVISARETESIVGSALQTTVSGTGTSLDSYFTNAFTGTNASANNSLANQLKLVARLIAGRSSLGNSRQIFFVQHGGYDTHTTQIPTTNPDTTGQTGLYNVLNASLKGFADALKSLGVWNDVTTFTASDFTRTFVANKSDATAGSDHAWGGHHLVLGGSVKGGRIYGRFPVLRLGAAANSIDATGSSGRWIPSTSVDQYAAVLARWLGVGSNELSAIFPNLARFEDPFTSTAANLDFLNLA